MDFVGGFDTAQAAARLKLSSVYVEPGCYRSFPGWLKLNRDSCSNCRAYDRAAIKFRGVEADINFNLGDYEEDLKQVIKHQKFIEILCSFEGSWLM